jgi:hypothetical protein
LRLHLGTNDSRANVEVVLPSVNMNGAISKLSINFDLNKVYAAQNTIDFNIDNDRQSISADDAFWIGNMKKNLEKSFTFGKAE